MKATGIVRRIDDLGRIVVPKEIRRTLRIREGDPLEIFTGSDGEVILKKYSPINDLSEFALEYVESIFETYGTPTLLSDCDEIIAVAGISKKEYVGRRISAACEDLLNERKVISEKLENSLELVPGQYEQVKSYVVAPILLNGDLIGAIYLLSKDQVMTDVELKGAEVAAKFLAKQMQQ